MCLVCGAVIFCLIYKAHMRHLLGRRDKTSSPPARAGSPSYAARLLLPLHPTRADADLRQAWTAWLLSQAADDMA